jgi:hypothetical protein
MLHRRESWAGNEIGQPGFDFPDASKARTESVAVPEPDAYTSLVM